ncbi:MAG TPA: AlpA family phage regulatory protein [Burkholderiaceae bacterium]
MISTNQWAQAHAAATGTRVTEVYLPSEGFIDEEVFCALLTVKRSTFWQGIKDGRYPKPVKVSARKNGWPVAKVRALFASLAGQADAIHGA